MGLAHTSPNQTGKMLFPWTTPCSHPLSSHLVYSSSMPSKYAQVQPKDVSS
jgi:hypothetical protein